MWRSKVVECGALVSPNTLDGSSVLIPQLYRDASVGYVVHQAAEEWRAALKTNGPQACVRMPPSVSLPLVVALARLVEQSEDVCFEMGDPVDSFRRGSILCSAIDKKMLVNEGRPYMHGKGA